MAHQIIKKVTKFIAKPVIRTELIWIGKCPRCGIKQESKNIYYVDKLCNECKLKKYFEERSDLVESIVGSTIIGLQWDSYADGLDEIAKVILLKPNGETSCIKSWDYSEDCDSTVKICEGV